MHHKHKQRAICLRRRRGTADATTEVDPVLRFRHLNTLPRLLFRVRPGLVGRQVGFDFILITLTFILVIISCSIFLRQASSLYWTHFLPC